MCLIYYLYWFSERCYTVLKREKNEPGKINVNLYALSKLYKATDRIASDMSKPIIKFEEINKHFSESDRKK